MSRQVRAFSLVEILVVLAILAVLAALIFPVFASARRSAKAVSCVSNLHQLGLATQMYQSDNDGLLPPCNPRAWVAFPGKTVQDPLKNYGMNRDTYHCPDYSGKDRVSDEATDFD